MSSQNPKPIIGITLDNEPAGGYAKKPWYALRENYCDTVAKWGGVPLLLPHEMTLCEHYFPLIQGLIITGGNFDIDPTLYGVSVRHETVITKDKRTSFEMKMAKLALEAQLPLLGICGGEQLLNVLCGGTLIQHIPDEIPQALAHEHPYPWEVAHEVSVVPNTLLSKITRQETLQVNTTHHQAVRNVGASIVVNAIAPDGVIEGIEHRTHPFCLGVQWHPEYETTHADSCIFEAMIDYAKSFQHT